MPASRTKTLPNGFKYYYDEDSKLHRDSGPAVISNSSKEWFCHGKRHRNNGPAIVYINNKKNSSWYLNDKRIDTADVEEWMKEYGINSWPFHSSWAMMFELRFL